MVEPIGPIPYQAMSKETPNVPALSQQMQDQVLTLADHLQKVFEDPTLTTQRSFLNEFASNVSNLNRTVDQAFLVR